MTSTNRPRLLILSLGGTITMVPSDSGGITPKLGAAELVASVPALAEVGDIDARSPFRLPSPSLTPANLIEVAHVIEEGFAAGFDGAVVIPVSYTHLDVYKRQLSMCGEQITLRGDYSAPV